MGHPCWHPAVLMPLSFVGTLCKAWEDGMAPTMSNGCPKSTIILGHCVVVIIVVVPVVLTVVTAN